MIMLLGWTQTNNENAGVEKTVFGQKCDVNSAGVLESQGVVGS